MRAHLQEPPVVLAFLADEDCIDRRFHVVVHAACARPLEEGEAAVVGVEHHFLRLARIGAREQHAAVAEPHVRHFHGHRRAVQHDDLVAPIELIGFARRKGQRHEGRRRGRAARLAPADRIAPDRVIAALVAEAAQFLEQPNEGQPLPRRLGVVFQQKRVELLAPGSDLGLRLRPAFVAKLGRARADHFPHDLPRHMQRPADLLDRSSSDEKTPGEFWRSSPQPAFQSRPPTNQEASVDPQPRGPDWMQITPALGSLFHAKSQTAANTVIDA